MLFRSTRISFAADSKPLQVSATLQRDWPVGSDELMLLSRQLERALELPVQLKLETVALFPLLKLDSDGNLDPASRTALSLIPLLPGGPDRYRFQIRGIRGRPAATVVQRYLTQTLNVTAPDVFYTRPPVRTAVPQGVRLVVLRRMKDS